MSFTSQVGTRVSVAQTDQQCAMKTRPKLILLLWADAVQMSSTILQESIVVRYFAAIALQPIPAKWRARTFAQRRVQWAYVKTG
jgi:hypothetical protein